MVSAAVVLSVGALGLRSWWTVDVERGGMSTCVPPQADDPTAIELLGFEVPGDADVSDITITPELPPGVELRVDRLPAGDDTPDDPADLILLVFVVADTSILTEVVIERVTWRQGWRPHRMDHGPDGPRLVAGPGACDEF